ncbi:hypothetical protein GCM10025782_33930 [Pedococcus ginsenosidimutans]|uniref:Uncharacterized protein n=1 Tax=Pedococcus ginsenosidimutans TaxID=490570 RepID=A0ABP8YM12_9MICO
MRLGPAEVVDLEQRRHHDQVLGDALGVLLAQGAQLVVHRTVELLARDALGDARLGQLGGTRRKPRTTATLTVVEGPGVALVAPTGSTTALGAAGRASTGTTCSGTAPSGASAGGPTCAVAAGAATVGATAAAALTTLTAVAATLTSGATAALAAGATGASGATAARGWTTALAVTT